jgi:hypothetical protein
MLYSTCSSIALSSVSGAMLGRPPLMSASYIPANAVEQVSGLPRCRNRGHLRLLQHCINLQAMPHETYLTRADGLQTRLAEDGYGLLNRLAKTLLV